MQFPVLSLLIFIPLLTGVALLVLPNRWKPYARWIALGSAGITAILSLIVYFGYDVAQGGYQFQEQYPWVPALGISYHVGVDGISVPMVLLSGLVVLSGVVVSWKVEDRPSEFFAFIMFLGASVLGVFTSLDLFQLFFFFEIAVFPKYLMIILWGYPKTREYGGMKLTIYLFLGSMVALVGALALYFGSGLRTFDLLELEKAGFPAEFQRLWFPFVFLGFGILGGIFPFHSWAPDGHVAAPTAVSMLLAGVEMKVGVFSALRIAIMLMPEGARMWAPLILGLGTVNVVYGALIALIQKDFKYVIGFSSVSHMGLVMLGFASLNAEGLTGAGMQMFSHGVMTALFFAIVGMVYDRTHTRELSKLGGLFRKMPIAAVGFIVAGMVSMGMPGFSGFIAEFPIFMGVWKASPVVAVIAILGVLITAAYILLVIRRVFFGDLPAEFEKSVQDIPLRDKLVVLGLSLVMVAIGWFPSLMVPMVQSGVRYILALLGGA
ncbi:MAG TPA: NADH-quinone oxidoreductase subunit M [Anaerolineaceae bacterium]|nr:NADH-quinone oxidoreductase subunit M [Anaerolineaceae bacterium]HQF45399.1 NADH-quinone oxidoreductase subunit M [Anaerolineaceae bacterium]HQH35264.1 NADH-quinone oxidoreductase subunit M [Anaerolineaceae bacterium]HQJ03265.1 NADH-quinone oxidoreductase subunit M [Anaerolineaceae bacterium]